MFFTNTILLALLLTTSIAAQVGGDTTFLRRFNGPDNKARQGVSVTGVGDINGDGLADFAFCRLSAYGAVQMVSGTTWQTIYEIVGTSSAQITFPVAGVGDVNGDGVSDVATCDSKPWTTFSTGVNIFSGATGQLLHRFDSNDIYLDFYYTSVSGAGDVNGDGYGDIIIGTPFAAGHGFLYSGAALVFSGATGVLLHTFLGWEADIYLGRSVDGAGDLDGDGFDDFLIGAPQASPPTGGPTGARFLRFPVQLGSAFFVSTGAIFSTSWVCR